MAIHCNVVSDSNRDIISGGSYLDSCCLHLANTLLFRLFGTRLKLTLLIFDDDEDLSHCQLVVKVSLSVYRSSHLDSSFPLFMRNTGKQYEREGTCGSSS